MKHGSSIMITRATFFEIAVYKASDLCNYIAKVHHYSLIITKLTCTSYEFHCTRINQNPNKATSIKLQQSGASDVLHGDTRDISQDSLASSSSPAVSQAHCLHASLQCRWMLTHPTQQWLFNFVERHEPCFRMNISCNANWFCHGQQICKRIKWKHLP